MSEINLNRENLDKPLTLAELERVRILQKKYHISDEEWNQHTPPQKHVSNIIEAELLSEGKNRLRITLSCGEIIEGYSWGIEPAFDDEGEELDYSVLVFDAEIPPAHYRLSEGEIKSVERA